MKRHQVRASDKVRASEPQATQALDLLKRILAVKVTRFIGPFEAALTPLLVEAKVLVKRRTDKPSKPSVTELVGALQATLPMLRYFDEREGCPQTLRTVNAALKSATAFCPQCTGGQLRELTDNEVESNKFDCAFADVPFNPETARICGKCGYLDV